MKKLIGSAILALSFLAFPSFSQAGDKPAEAPKTERKAPGMPFNGTISAVDKTAKTITLGETEKARVFQITSETKIYKEKKPATFDDAVVGERVGGYARKNADGKLEVATLNIGLPVKNAKAKLAEKKPVN
jgi:hypothetical protein